MFSIKGLLVKLLRDTADKIEANNCELSETEALDLVSLLSHEAMSKEKACIYLNLSRSRFDELVREGVLPRGKKRAGFKELVFYKDELDLCIRQRNASPIAK